MEYAVSLIFLKALSCRARMREQVIDLVVIAGVPFVCWVLDMVGAAMGRWEHFGEELFHSHTLLISRVNWVLMPSS